MEGGGEGGTSGVKHHSHYGTPRKNCAIRKFRAKGGKRYVIGGRWGAGTRGDGIEAKKGKKGLIRNQGDNRAEPWEKKTIDKKESALKIQKRKGEGGVLGLWLKLEMHRKKTKTCFG